MGNITNFCIRLRLMGIEVEECFASDGDRQRFGKFEQNNPTWDLFSLLSAHASRRLFFVKRESQFWFFLVTNYLCLDISDLKKPAARTANPK
jgi:hypothetical protein